MDNLLIIGGSDAGISAALRAKEMAPYCGVTVMLADDYPNYSICGLPFFLSGEIPDWRALAHRTREELLRQGIRLLTSHKATAIRPEEKIVVASSSSGEKTFSYDRLILATGAASRKPGHIKGLDTPGVFSLRWMADSFAIAQHIERTAPTSALIIGSGYIGLEMADALTRRGLVVTLVGHSQHVLKTVDPALGRLVVAELERNSVCVASGVGVEEIGARNSRLVAFGPGGFQAQADLVLVATGAEPEVGLAKSGEVPLGYQANADVVRGWEWMTAGDNRVCPICLALHGREFKLGEGPATPIHPRCRCVRLPKTVTWRELGIPMDEMKHELDRWIIRGRKDYDGEIIVRGVHEGGKDKTLRVGRYATADDWFSNLSDAEKRSTSLGPGRVKLLEDGLISMKDLVGPDYQPRTLKQLEALADAR